tara:strand:+ start:427 stop:750 length:324 start_codon:yes stop_codon:yes gene_type:complete
MSDFKQAISIDANDHVNILVEVQTGSLKDAVGGYNKWRNRILFSVTSNPIKGEANKSLLFYISNLFGCNSTDVSIVYGFTSRQKKVQIRAVSFNHIIKTLEYILEGE